jgi:hypothetical protein
MTERGAWNRPVLVADGRTFTVADVILAAHGRGELQPAWTSLLELVECEKRAAGLAERDDVTADEGTLQSMSERFRYERDLITAEETERWLVNRGLTLEDFDAYFLRHYWAGTLEEPAEPEALDYRSAPDEFWDLLMAELQLSGELDRMAQRLGWRLAAAHAQRDEPAPAADLLEPDSAAARGDPALEEWHAALGGDPRFVEDLPRLEAAYQRECRRLMTPDQVGRSLVSRRLALMRVDLETVDVDSLDAVHEVIMCVRDDGLSMSEVASEGHYPYERMDVILEDLLPDVQQRVLRAAPGEMLGPVPHDGGFHVHRLVGRADPDLADAEVRERVERQLLEHHFSELTAPCIRWIMSPDGTP